MRHLIHAFCALTGLSNLLFAVSVEPSGVISPSSVFRLQNVTVLSYRSTEEVWNKTGHFSSGYLGDIGQDGISMTAQEFLSYKLVSRHVVHLRPRGSRTIPNSRRLEGELRFSATKTVGALPTEITIWSTFLAGCRVLFVAGICLLWLFYSASGICCLLKDLCVVSLWIITQYFSLLVRTLTLGVIYFWAMIIWIDETAEYVPPWFMDTIDLLCARFNHFRDIIDAKEQEWRTLECILRKRPIGRRGIHRPSGQKSAVPLFRDQTHQCVQHLYLPEERGSLLRHMHDPRHLNHLKKIGAGAFGSIYLVEHRITGKTMAMKALVRRDNSSEEIGLEIRALLRLQGKLWFPKLLSTFMDPTNFYILMPFYARGDLYSVMNSSGGCLSRELCQFYLAELIIALQGLHKAGILHRDIKPDNILFDKTGHVVVADFGVAHVFTSDEEDDTFMEEEYPLWEEMKALNDDCFPLLTPSIDNPHTIKGVAGTPFYAAPEVLAGQEYSYGVDYYSLAIVYHEMVTGYVPIQCGPCQPGDSEPTITLDLGRKDVHLQPISVSDYDFLSRMLEEDYYARPTVKQMKEHPVFAGIDWDKLSRQEVPIPRASVLRKRVPISPGFERCLTESSRGSL